MIKMGPGWKGKIELGTKACVKYSKRTSKSKVRSTLV